MELRDKGHRLVLDHLSIEGVELEATPERTRITVREGAHAVWLDADGVRVASVSGRRGVRPWTVHRGAP